MRLVALAAAALLVLVGTGAALSLVGHDDDVAPAGVSVEGVDVAGMTPAAARRAVRARAAEMMREPVVITRAGDEDFELVVPPPRLGAEPRIDEAVQAALEPHGWAGRLLESVGLAPSRDVDIAFALQPDAVDRVVRQANAGFDDPPAGASLRVTDDDIVVVPGRAGVGVDEAELRTRLTGLPARIELEVGRQDAPVDDATAEAARRRALALVSAPIRVSFQGNAVGVSPAVLRDALRFESRPPDIAVLLDEDTIYEDIAPAFVARETEPRDARFDVDGDTVRLVPSADGRSLDMAAIVAGMAAPPEDRTVRARFRVTEPEIVTDDLAGLGIRELVGSFSTPYNCCEPRVENIRRGAETIDGTILPPGHRFSLSDALGPRTLDNGYVAAPQIAGGRLEEGIGGGVSQIATTLYNAAFFAGLEIEAHTPHSFYISRYPRGREATISMGGPDLVFVNDWDASLLISAQAGDNDITIRLFSTLQGRRVETTGGEPFDYVEPEEIEEEDPSLEPGEREVDQYMGSSGFTVEYTRTVWQGDRVRRDETYRWTYRPQNAYVRVGPEREDDGEQEEPGATTTDGEDAPPPDAPAPDDAAPPPDAPAPTGGTPGGAAPPPPLP